jgi:hypothetical protein
MVTTKGRHATLAVVKCPRRRRGVADTSGPSRPAGPDALTAAQQAQAVEGDQDRGALVGGDADGQGQAAGQVECDQDDDEAEGEDEVLPDQPPCSLRQVDDVALVLG